VAAGVVAALERLGEIALRPDDSEEERIRKATLVLAPVFISVLSVAWVVTYALYGLWLSAAIPFAYQVCTVVGLAWVARTQRIAGFRRVQLALMLVLPFALQWSLGGFAESSAVGLWAFFAPVGALLFQGGRAAVPWFAGFLLLLVVSAVIDASLQTDGDELPEWLTTTFFVLNLGGVALTSFVTLQYVLHQLAGERERSERLLLNVLPASIARRLKRSPGIVADRYEDVSVLFADLSGFTPAVERMPPEEVVGLLDAIFSVFDVLVDERGLEKIKTIGDGYLVAGGVPVAVADHAERIADLALAMQASMEARRAEDLTLRIGIDVGPVVAGVIGRSKFGYDVWGDTVNTASRMESHAPSGAIQVTGRVYDRLRDRFALEARGTVEIKGKGAMPTYLLRGERVAPPAAGEAPSGPVRTLEP
jgi:adenylate cyclase